MQKYSNAYLRYFNLLKSNVQNLKETPKLLEARFLVDFEKATYENIYWHTVVLSGHHPVTKIYQRQGAIKTDTGTYVVKLQHESHLHSTVQKFLQLVVPAYYLPSNTMTNVKNGKFTLTVSFNCGELYPELFPIAAITPTPFRVRLMLMFNTYDIRANATLAQMLQLPILTHQENTEKKLNPLLRSEKFNFQIHGNFYNKLVNYNKPKTQP